MPVALDYVVPGTIGDYASLVEKVGLWMDRTDLEDRIPDFIALVEARLNRLLRTINQETRDIWVISAETYALPSDYRKMRKIHIEGSPDRPLDEISPVAAPRRFSGDSGTPLAYWTEGRTLVLAPPPSEETTFRVTYFTRIAPLTVNAPSNWVLEEHPDIYVWGTLMEAAAYIRDPEAVGYCEGRYETGIAELQLESATDRWGGGPLVPTSVSQVRGGRR